MPELPEVERARKLAERVAAGRCITRVHCADDAIVFDGVSPRRIRGALRNRTVRGVGRRGKYLWFELDERPWPVFHFGMTGAFRVPHEDPLPLESSPKVPDRSWPPRFTKLGLEFDDGAEIAMTNARRLGRILLRDDPLAQPPIAKLGFDPLLDLPTARRLGGLLQNRQATLKGLLLNQSFAAGVGNWIADEVLFQAGLDPRRSAASLSDAEVRRLRSRLRSVVVKAVAVNAEKDRFPKSWLFHHRWGKDTDARTSRGESIEHITVAGRTTAWVPTVQR